MGTEPKVSIQLLTPRAVSSADEGFTVLDLLTRRDGTGERWTWSVILQSQEWPLEACIFLKWCRKIKGNQQIQGLGKVEAIAQGHRDSEWPSGVSNTGFIWLQRSGPSTWDVNLSCGIRSVKAEKGRGLESQCCIDMGRGICISCKIWPYISWIYIVNCK